MPCPEFHENLYALIGELCAFVDRIPAAVDDVCAVPLAEAHRARNTVANLRPLAAKYEAADALAAGALHPDCSDDEPSTYIHNVQPNAPR